ncbi:MAG: hypothetical protein KDA92_16060, partial [Planctomycetales bacterium]|nr:hypothetical protein [Planctomycetales bacterium]
MASRVWACALALITFLCSASLIEATTISLPVAFDRWMYPFNATPGSRASGSLFGSGLSPSFDDRDAQIILGFDMAEAAALSADHALTAISLQVTTAADHTFEFDGTTDLPSSYINEELDEDVGRPIELFGVGTRNGYDGLSLGNSSESNAFLESSPYSAIPGVFRSSRSAFAAAFIDGQLTDVSNAISENHWAEPWAIADTILSPGIAVPIETALRFDLPLADESIRKYLDAGFDRGELFFALTSLHTAAQAGPASYPSLYLDAGGISLGPTATLHLEFEPVQAGDFNHDGTLNLHDIELLSAAIQRNVGELAYDVNRDEQLTLADQTFWVHELQQTWLGDANLDGRFDSTDLIQVFQAGEYEDTLVGNSNWADGDWNADGDFTTADLVSAFADGGYGIDIGGDARSSISAVPEPACGHVVLL